MALYLVHTFTLRLDTLGALHMGEQRREELKNMRFPPSPVIAAGDFNVAVENQDFWNPQAKHTEQQAGTTPAERASFRLYTDPPSSSAERQQCTPNKWIDSFRHLYPKAQGQFTFWSARARNRPSNRGLRLDYFLVSPGMLAGLRDVQHRQDLEGSDHCPVLLELDMSQMFYYSDIGVRR